MNNKRILIATWEQRKVEKLLEAKDGVRRGPFGSALKKEYFVEKSNFVVYEQQNAIYDNYETRYKISENKFQELNKFSLRPNDFIMSGAGTIGRISRVPEGIKPGVFNQALIRFRINNVTTDSEYFLQFIRADFMQKKLTGANPGSAITNLVPMSEVKNWVIQVPIIEEQKKIGTFFKNLDNLITLHQRKYDLLISMKQSYLGKLFPKNGEDVPEIRFVPFTDVWEQRKLGDLVKINGRIGFRGYTQSDIITKEEGGVLTFSPTNIVNNSLTLDVNNTYITKVKYEESPEIMVQNGNILFVKTGSTLGKSALIQELKEDATINPQIVVLTTSEKSKKIISTLLTSNQVQKQVAKAKIGGAVPTLTETEIKKFEIYLPKEDNEKVELGTFFQKLDDTIALHQTQIEQLKNIKKSLLNKMFI